MVVIDSEELKVITTKMPTYLKALLNDDCDITLVYNETEELVTARTFSETETSKLDLTGAPLKVELGGGSDTFLTTQMLERPPSWTSEEASQGSMSFKQAQKYFYDNRVEQQEEQLPVYCLCDGKHQSVVVLGTFSVDNTWMRCFVKILPVEGISKLTLEHFRGEHLKLVRKPVEVKSSIKKCHYLFGYDLQNSTEFNDVENNGSFSVTTTMENTSVALKANMQLIIGHWTSSMNQFWEEFSFIQSLFEMFSSTENNCASTQICKNPLQCEEVKTEISNLLDSSNQVKKELRTSENLNLNNLRYENILDKLWLILKQCGNLSDLRDCFVFFFEEFAETQRKIHDLDNLSTLGMIMNKLLSGKMVLFNFSFLQNLGLLVELGLEKLKKDYIAIIGHFEAFPKATLLKNWSDISTVNNQAHKKMDRLTFNHDDFIKNLGTIKCKLEYLHQMHVVTDFMLLYNDVNVKLCEDSFERFCKTLYDKFIDSNCVLENPHVNLHQLSFDLNSIHDAHIVKDKFPTNWTVSMSSKICRVETNTVYHMSEQPIFPKSIFEDYSEPVDSEEKLYYVSKVEMWIEDV